MNTLDFEQKMEAYADLAIHVGLNLQKGQRLLIRGPLVYGAPISAAPLILALTKSAYQAGARLVDVMWGDEQTELLRFQYAPRDSFEEVSAWKTDGPYEHVKRGDAVISISGINPDLLKGQDPDLVSLYTTSIWKKLDPFLKVTSNNNVNWLVISGPTPGWSAKVFPNLTPDEREAKMWETIFKLCRLDRLESSCETPGSQGEVFERKKVFLFPLYRTRDRFYSRISGWCIVGCCQRKDEHRYFIYRQHPHRRGIYPAA
jgi:aminopeptidase